MLTWTKSLTDSSKRAFGDYHWLAAIHEHHDHRPERTYPPRFARAYICGNCNSADGAVKRRFKLPADFSFSPQELSKFVVGYPHCGVEIDFEAAKSLYDSAGGVF